MTLRASIPELVEGSLPETRIVTLRQAQGSLVNASVDRGFPTELSAQTTSEEPGGPAHRPVGGTR